MAKRRIEPLVNGRVQLGLLEEADLPMTMAESWKLRKVFLTVRDENRRAIAIYEACGFNEVGRRDGVIAMRVGVLPNLRRLTMLDTVDSNDQ